MSHMMSAILDTIVPSRRREKRRLRALEDRLHDRWGDPSITAPIEGGWNSIDAVDTQGDSYPSFQPLSPVDEARYDASDASDTETQAEGKHIHAKDKMQENDRQQATLTLTIPLPWQQKKGQRGLSSSDYQSPRAAALADTSASTRRSRSQSASPAPFLYKPASNDYRRDLESTLGQVSSPPVLYKPASDDYMKELDTMARRPEHNNLDSAPYESTARSGHAPTTMTSEYKTSEQEGSAAMAPMSPATDRKLFTEKDGTTVSRSSLSSTDASNASTSHTGSYYSEVTKGMSELGFSPATSPVLKNEGFGKSVTSLMPRTRAYRESVSSSSSDGSSVHSPRGLLNATMPSGGIYKSVAEDYKQIGKTVEDAAVANFRQKVRRKTLQLSPANTIYENFPERHQSPSGRIQSNVVNDRSRGYSRERTRAGSKEKIRAASADRLNKTSRGRSRGVPDEMVPASEDLWG